MKSGPQLALGLMAGYFLGRNRRMRLTIMIGTAAATGGLGAAGGQLLRRGTKLVASSEVMSEISPALEEITDTIRGELAEAAKNAAKAAVSSRIDSLSDSLHSRAEALQHPEDLAEDAGAHVRGVGGRVKDIAGNGGLGAQEREDEEEDSEEEEEAPVYRRRATRPRRPPEPEEEREVGEEVAEEPPARRHGRLGLPAAGSPIRRARSRIPDKED